MNAADTLAWEGASRPERVKISRFGTFGNSTTAHPVGSAGGGQAIEHVERCG